MAALAAGIIGLPESPPIGKAHAQEEERVGQHETDHDAIQGRWIFESAKRGGDDLLDTFWDGRVVFSGDRATISKILPIDLPTRFQLDSQAKPKHLDFEVNPLAAIAVKLPTETFRGIYELEEDTLRICYCTKAGGERPTEFRCEAGSDRCLMVMRRHDVDRVEPWVDVRVVDAAGNAVEGALASTFAIFDDTEGGSDRRYPEEAVADGDGVVRFRSDDLRRSCIIARHPARHLVGIRRITPVDLQQDVTTITMHPACRVTGLLTCDELARREREPGFTVVYLELDGVRAAARVSNDPRFQFVVPPGTYTLYAYGEYVDSARKTFTVAPGEPEWELGPISLPPTKLALLVGKPAPELRGVVAWKNSPPLALADLRGKCVLLEFWGAWCGPCIESMPELFELHDKHQAEGLAIVGIHVDPTREIDSAHKLDEGLAGIREKQWGGRDIPFPVGLTLGQGATSHPGVPADAVSPVAADYGIDTFPTSVLIDREGRIVGLFFLGRKSDRDLLERMLRGAETKKTGTRAGEDGE